MREINFRGKNKVTGQWLYGSLIIRNDIFYCIHNRYLGEFEVDANTVGQFTGLKDKNGVEIYEGDIIDLMLHTGEKEKFICEYKTEKNGFRFISQEANDDCWYIIEGNNTIEVVGNIHD